MEKPNASIRPPPLYACMYITPPVVVSKAAKDAKIGHGLGSTK
jgi:hypothetical protein